MATNIRCPHCTNAFDVEDVLSSDVEQKLKREYEKKYQQSLTQIEAERKKLAEQEAAFEEKRKNQNDIYQQQLQKDRQKMEAQFAADKQKLEAQALANKQRFEAELQQQIHKSISQDFENQLRVLKESDREKEEKLKTARQKELDFMRKEKELKTQSEELELKIERTLQEQRESLTKEIRAIELQRVAQRETDMLMRQKELEKQLEDQKKLAEEMKRKAEQGSMQLQGEVQELALEDMLKTAFPFDVVCEVGKGMRGADCLLTIRNNYGQECGRIIFESKRTKDFGADWIEKLKADMRAEGADLGLIVTQAMPKGMDRFGEKDGIWICSFAEAKALVHVLRDGIIKIFNAAKKQENRGDKTHLLYDYLTSQEFAEQWKGVREGFLSMRLSIQKERDGMEKMWKAREKHLEKILLNAAYIKGSIEGIAGQDSIDFSLMDETDDGQALLAG